jgi:hypothetical protein
MSKARCRAVNKGLKHEGPYLPVVFEACGEKEYASEYEHGVISYGAFTYSLANNLRRHRTAAKAPTFSQLLKETAQTLSDLHYDQHPVLVGPDQVVKNPIPWQGLVKGKK